MSISEVARRVGVNPWQILRLCETGKIPEPPRAGNRRIFSEDHIPLIRQALSERRQVLS
jgi:DNA-binding transcriptional MerR regulator